ncbi:hypothetical protein DPMN_077897 [Dreissena polymorpha]|uniref:C-type lectin domain-containing protein n=1 Tax=Dreissena polymorpha TaxID=45954 RepID=A0A9D4BH15_DREPO|nr:hypothetical protein DPMN_077897 [Dreissena polymorpha]
MLPYKRWKAAVGTDSSSGQCGGVDLGNSTSSGSWGWYPCSEVFTVICEKRDLNSANVSTTSPVPANNSLTAEYGHDTSTKPTNITISTNVTTTANQAPVPSSLSAGHIAAWVIGACALVACIGAVLYLLRCSSLKAKLLFATKRSDLSFDSALF